MIVVKIAIELNSEPETSNVRLKNGNESALKKIDQHASSPTEESESPTAERKELDMNVITEAEVDLEDVKIKEYLKDCLRR